MSAFQVLSGIAAADAEAEAMFDERLVKARWSLETRKELVSK